MNKELLEEIVWPLTGRYNPGKKHLKDFEQAMNQLRSNIDKAVTKYYVKCPHDKSGMPYPLDEDFQVFHLDVTGKKERIDAIIEWERGQWLVRFIKDGKKLGCAFPVNCKIVEMVIEQKPKDTQELIDSEVAMAPRRYCQKYNIEYDPDDDAMAGVAKMRHLLKRQKELNKNE